MRIAIVTCSLLVLDLLGAAVAHADPDLDVTRAELQLPALRDPTGPEDPEAPWLAGVGYAALIASSRGVGAAVGAHVAMTGFRCNLVDASAQAVVGSSHAALDTSYRVCLLGAPIVLVVGGTKGAGLEPAIDARRSLWRSRYDVSSQHTELGLGNLGPRSKGGTETRHSVFMMAMDRTVTTQTAGADSQRTLELDFDFSLYRLSRVAPDSTLQLDALVLDSTAVAAGATELGGVALSVFPVALSASTPHWFGSARAGTGHLGGTTTQSTSTEVNGQVVSSTSDTIDGSGLPTVAAAVGDATLGLRRGSLTASLTVARSVFATFDGNQALDARASGTLSYVHGKTTVTVAPFIARTRTWTRTPAVLDERSLGATLHVQREMTHHLGLAAFGQVGRTPYARLDDTRDQHAVTGGSVVVALSAHRRIRGLHGRVE